MLVSEVEREGRVRGARGAQGAGRRVGVFGLAWVAMCEEVVLGMMTVSASWAAAVGSGVLVYTICIWTSSEKMRTDAVVINSRINLYHSNCQPAAQHDYV
jgi:hypothetical protein